MVESLQSLAFALAAVLNSWVALCVVEIFNVEVVQVIAVVLVQNLKGLLHKGQTERVQVAADCLEELIITYESAPVPVENVEEHSDVLSGDVQLLLQHRLGEFVDVETSALVFVYSFELACDSNDGGRPSSQNGVPDVFHQQANSKNYNRTTYRSSLSLGIWATMALDCSALPNTARVNSR